MIKTLFLQDTLNSAQGFVLALIIGMLFGFILHRAGFGSSRKLAGVFYLTDMTVIKVMFTAVMVAMLGLAFLSRFGWIAVENVYWLPTVYGAQVIGGLVFGIGFVVGGWCPGTAAAGLAGGKLDALIFLVGAVLGSIGFNELFGLIKPLYTAGDRGIWLVHESLGLSQGSFVLLFVVIGTLCFVLCEYLEKRAGRSEPSRDFRLLKAVSLLLIVLAATLLFLPQSIGREEAAASLTEQALLTSIEQAEDHMEPEELADRLVAGDSTLLLVDTRSPAEFAGFHIRGAVNVALPDLSGFLESYRLGYLVVLYSQGMTHPAQARDSLARQGFGNVYILTDGLSGFMERCLKPVSLRSAPVDQAAADKIRSWRDFFYGKTTPDSPPAEFGKDELVPAIVETDWLAARLGRPDLVVIDLRSQPEYSTGHIPGSLRLDVESLRGNVGGVGSMLLPADMLARHFSLMGVTRTNTVILSASSKFHDATLAATACRRLGHQRHAVLNGGFEKWSAENRGLDNSLPSVRPSLYAAEASTDPFTVDYEFVHQAVKARDALIIDVRPTDYYSGQKSDEARAGHIPGAVNRPYTEDTVKGEKFTAFRSLPELQKAYAGLIPGKTGKVIVHCRTGHQASQTFYVLTRLLGYTNVFWYDAGWTEWAAREELPIAASASGLSNL